MPDINETVNRSREFNSIKNKYNLTNKDDGEFWFVFSIFFD